MKEIQKLWEDNEYSFEKTDISYIVKKKTDFFTKVIKFNLEDKRFYAYNTVEDKYSDIKPVWIDSDTFKLIRKTARLLKWKI